MYDTNFLKELDQWPQREVFAKIISLSWDEKPREEIEGYITGGSISVNGASAMRRTCNLTMVTDTTEINALYWALESKFEVYIGLKNLIYINSGGTLVSYLDQEQVKTTVLNGQASSILVKFLKAIQQTQMYRLDDKLNNGQTKKEFLQRTGTELLND